MLLLVCPLILVFCVCQVMHDDLVLIVFIFQFHNIVSCLILILFRLLDDVDRMNVLTHLMTLDHLLLLVYLMIELCDVLL